jgi:Bacterial Ig-like domain (group 1)
MKGVTVRRLLALLSLGALVLLFQAFTAGAAPGDGLAAISTAPPCSGAIKGIGVAFDGNNILFTCADEAKIHKTDLAGTNLGAVDIKDASSNPVAVDAIAWDSNEGLLWGGNLDGAGHCQIWKIDLATGLAALQFTFTDPSGFCGDGAEFYDGITVDTKSNTLYLSPDVNPTIRHFNKAGNPLPGDPIPFSTMTTGQCPVAQGFGFPGCLNSGLAIGIDGHLFAGTDGDGKIFDLDPTVPSVLGQFATVSGRDEDLECGPLFTKPDASVVETILSREAFSGRIDVLEAPLGTCVVFQLGLTPSSATNFTGTSHTVTATLTANGSALAGRTILFSVSGANTASGSGASDSSGQASFTYTGTNPGDDTITACADINNNGSCDPEEPTATASKTWEAQITVTGTTFNAIEGNSVSAVVATVTDPDPASTASEYSATIDWGDGSPTSAGTLSGPTGGPFDVNGTHTYVEEGTYTVTVKVTDTDFPANNGTAVSTAVVADAQLSATCATPAVSLQAFSGNVATFTDANPFGEVLDFSATIDWGDGSPTSAGVVSGPVGGPFAVSGAHNYASTGPFTIAVHVADVGGSTADVSCSVLIFAFAPGGGAFVIGDGSSANGTNVTFWGSQWSKLNSLSGGAAPASFKGFAENPSVPSCGTDWSTDPGNSAPPPAGPLPAFMGVIVTSSTSKSGAQISGNTPHIVVVQTNAGYDTNPGHAGTGTVVAQVC